MSSKIDGKAPPKLPASVKSAMARGIPLHKAMASQPNKGSKIDAPK